MIYGCWLLKIKEKYRTMSRTYEKIVNIFNCLDSYDKLMDFQAFPFCLSTLHHN